jgi:hypothetical protein
MRRQDSMHLSTTCGFGAPPSHIKCIVLGIIVQQLNQEASEFEPTTGNAFSMT